MRAIQLDLLNPDAETRRLVDGLTCLRDVVPEAMDVVIHLEYWWRDERSICGSGDWAYSIRRKGIRFEHVDDWWTDAHERGEVWGWDRTPAHLITWGELAELLGGDPRRPQLLAWAASLTAPDSWLDRMRPHELWPKPGQWHPSYITSDHARPGWDQRIAAWRTLQAIITDAITRLEVT